MIASIGGGESSVTSQIILVWWWAGVGEGMLLQRKRDDGETPLDKTDGTIGQLHRATFCTLKHASNCHYPVIYLGSGLSFDASSEVCRWGLGPCGGRWPCSER